ncbi:hypothetical protein CCHL11_00844 [Colletotrichum chlorophyti]|uniref:Uncharacterized protein n=1 Tax=Colletotrichum chlorophyti TaxID=708187 RepID=A0A1Q8S521_9PEZI|nr:hypothetical protein CCHL11_00844 [Colletotrichum chlorophyti]
MSYSDQKSSEAYMGNPPPYYRHNDEVPQYHTPRFNDAATDSRTLIPATSKFPPTFNCYYTWKLKQVYYLGPSSEDPQYAIAYDYKLFSKKESLHLHNGPTNKAPILATVSRKALGWHDKATITLHGDNGEERTIAFEKPEDASWTSWSKSQVRAFRFRVHKDGEEEEFQWRTSNGNEIKELAGHSSGWKLVRVGLPEPSAGGARKERDLGVTSDGQEVVAVLAHNMSFSMSKGYKFAFMGTGLTGTLGAEWETTAVLSGFWLWWLSLSNSTTSASSASAASAAAAAAT